MKFANVTYGTHGDSAEYTYLVNDNVKAGEVLQPSVIHYQSKKVLLLRALCRTFPNPFLRMSRGKLCKSKRAKIWAFPTV